MCVLDFIFKRALDFEDQKTQMVTLANSIESDEMPHKAPFNQSLHCLLRQNQSSEKYNVCLEIITCDPSIYKIDHHDLTVSNLMANSIGTNGFCHFPMWCLVLDCIDSWYLLSSLLLTLNAPIATKVVCFSRLLKCLRSLYDKQCGLRSDCSYRSSLFWVHIV